MSFPFPYDLCNDTVQVPMKNSSDINWTNPSVQALSADSDPIETIKAAARRLVLKAKEEGWEGPPFNPVRLAEMLKVQIEANSSVADARLIATENGAKIQFNPLQPRERVRFSIAHEIAHLLFPDWKEQIRNRSANEGGDNWQLEMLCNLAASEFVLPIGSLKPAEAIPTIEVLMQQRRAYDVSAEAFLIRLAKISNKPIGIFVSSPTIEEDETRHYKIDYFVNSPTAPALRLSGMQIPNSSVVQSCTAIGHTDRAVENWLVGDPTQIECVGLAPYPGAVYPRVAGVIRFDQAAENHSPIRLVHGDILRPLNGGKKIICQLVNDKATKWGGGVARKIAKRFPEAERAYFDAITEMPLSKRLGQVVFTWATDEVLVASLIGQEGFGPSLFPRIRYSALQRCLSEVAAKAVDIGASLHMPRIGTGSAGGDWSTIEEIIDDVIIRAGLSVTIYDLPPKRVQLELL